MVDILHKIGVKSQSKDAAYKALATREGLSGWWTNDVEGDGKVGSVLHFHFGTRGFIDMKVAALDPGKRVLWEVVDGPDVWIGTEVSFDLRQDGDYTVVLFKHQGWREPSEFMHHCSTKWATFLMGMKSLVETGKANPFPNDIKVAEFD